MADETTTPEGTETETPDTPSTPTAPDTEAPVFDPTRTPVSVANMQAYEKQNKTRFEQLEQRDYDGRNLSEVFALEIVGYTDDAAWFNARIKAGNFDGIYVKDYFDIKLSDGKVMRYRIGAIDPYLNCCDEEITDHHVMMVPDTVWPDSVVWNTTNNNNGNASEKHPYLASNLHKWLNQTFFPLLPQKWKNVIANHRTLLEERYSSTAALTESTTWSWADMGKVWALSETEVYGFNVWGNGYSVGMDCHFPIFPDTASRIRRNPDGDRFHWWLRGAISGDSTYACNVGGDGYASSYFTSTTGVRPLPCFRVGV